MEIIKYPRTQHLSGSNLQIGDEDLQQIDFSEIKSQHIVLEEKVDGANSGISFDYKGNLYLQSRGHFLNGGYGEKQFSLFKCWANSHYSELYKLLKNRYILYGEWLYAKHTIFYDALPHYFLEFDIYDKENQYFLSTKKRKELVSTATFLVSVPVLFEGNIHTFDELKYYLGKSNFKTSNLYNSLQEQCRSVGISFDIVKKQTDLSDLMEGIYIKVENQEQVLNRLKYVRASFINTILDSESHWVNRPILPNILLNNAGLF